MLKIVNCSTGIDDIVFTAVETRLFHKAKKIGNIDIFQITENLQIFQIADFYVDPEYRHSGIGKKMLAKAERHIIKKYNANVLTSNRKSKHIAEILIIYHIFCNRNNLKIQI